MRNVLDRSELREPCSKFHLRLLSSSSSSSVWLITRAYRPLSTIGILAISSNPHWTDIQYHRELENRHVPLNNISWRVNLFQLANLPIFLPSMAPPPVSIYVSIPPNGFMMPDYRGKTLTSRWPVSHLNQRSARTSNYCAGEQFFPISDLEYHCWYVQRSLRGLEIPYTVSYGVLKLVWLDPSLCIEEHDLVMDEEAKTRWQRAKPSGQIIGLPGYLVGGEYIGVSPCPSSRPLWSEFDH